MESASSWGYDLTQLQDQSGIPVAFCLACVWQIWHHKCTEWLSGSKRSSAHNEASPWSCNRAALSSPPGEMPFSCCAILLGYCVYSYLCTAYVPSSRTSTPSLSHSSSCPLQSLLPYHTLPASPALHPAAILLAALQYHLLFSMFENDRYFSYLSELEREMSFRTEMVGAPNIGPQVSPPFLPFPSPPPLRACTTPITRPLSLLPPSKGVWPRSLLTMSRSTPVSSTLFNVST